VRQAAAAQLDLFKYPRRPGARDRATSREAAAKIATIADTLRAKVLATIRANPEGLTADEVAKRIATSILSVRPRVSELVAGGNIKRSVTRRKNESGMSAAVWVINADR
jgi:hypothetical protein